MLVYSSKVRSSQFPLIRPRLKSGVLEQQLFTTVGRNNELRKGGAITMLSGEYFYPVLPSNTKKARFQEDLELPESRKDGFDDRLERQLEQQYLSKVVSHKNTFRYVRFGLSTETLVPETKKLLEMLGVECLEEGGPGEAYGIIVANEHALIFLERVTGVTDATLQDPPCSK